MRQEVRNEQLSPNKTEMEVSPSVPEKNIYVHVDNKTGDLKVKNFNVSESSVTHNNDSHDTVTGKITVTNKLHLTSNIPDNSTQVFTDDIPFTRKTLNLVNSSGIQDDHSTLEIRHKDMKFTIQVNEEHVMKNSPLKQKIYGNISSTNIMQDGSQATLKADNNCFGVQCVPVNADNIMNNHNASASQQQESLFSTSPKDTAILRG